MRETKGEKIFNLVNIVFLFLIIVAVLVPLFNVVSISFISSRDLETSKFVIIPSHLDFKAYTIIFSNGSTILDAYKITLFRVVIGTLVSLMVTYFLAYGLACRDLPGRGAISLFVFITMLFGGGLIPTYILIKNLGLMNNLLVYILPVAVNAFNALLIRNFIMNIPDALKESAEIDGAFPRHRPLP
jgi:putative aldouronate transport system permease protein